jgi:hypothetical protein
MTKKHCIILAMAIARATDSNGHIIHKDQLLSLLTEALRNDNPQFDGFRFINACNQSSL